MFWVTLMGSIYNTILHLLLNRLLGFCLKILRQFGATVLVKHHIYCQTI